MSKYTSKYPRILVDNDGNSVNESLAKKLTIEEYYDLLHHSHSAEALVVGEGIMSYNEMSDNLSTLSDMVNNLIGIVQVQQVTIDELKNELSSIANIRDWDVTTPGIQDANGNNLGELMGFQMTEIE